MRITSEDLDKKFVRFLFEVREKADGVDPEEFPDPSVDWIQTDNGLGSFAENIYYLLYYPYAHQIFSWSIHLHSSELDLIVSGKRDQLRMFACDRISCLSRWSEHFADSFDLPCSYCDFWDEAQELQEPLSFSSFQEWALAFLDANPNSRRLQLEKAYNRTPGLSEKFGGFRENMKLISKE